MDYFTNSLTQLPLLKKGKSRCINWENRTGEKGKGGMAESVLGPSRKGSPCIPKVAAGETVTLAELIGCMLPMLAKRCRLDPAIMAAPLITTVLDTCTILVYFNIVTAFFKI